MSKMKWNILTVLYMGLIIYESLKPYYPQPGDSKIKEFFHNVAHIPAYSLLVYLFLHNFLKQGRREQSIAFVGAVLFGVGLEILQGFFPGREPSLLDIASNTLGAGLTLFLLKHNYIRLMESSCEAKG